jgi:hypothetical protein
VNLEANQIIANSTFLRRRSEDTKEEADDELIDF